MTSRHRLPSSDGVTAGAGLLAAVVVGLSLVTSIAPQYVASDAEGGRGLVIVDALVAEMGGAWGFTDEGTCAWVHLALAGLGR